MRTVALYQTGSDKDGSTVYYEFGRAVLRDDAHLQLTAFHQEDLQRWIKQGVPVKQGYVPAREGDAFLSALRDDYNKGGRTFALDSQTETIPPSLFLVPGSRKFEETIPVKIPRGASARQENALHRAADAHLDDLTALMIAAFNKGRAVIRKDPQNATGAIEAVKKYLHAELPDILLTIHDDGGTVAMDRLVAMRTAGGRGSGNPEPKAAARKITFDSGSDAAVSWADQHAAELIDNISENSREDIGNAIAAAIEDGDLSSAMDDILDAVGDKTRAELIARTEIMRAVNAGQREAWNQAVDDGLLSGDEQRTWIATDDELVCPICNDLDGETIGLDDQYSDGSDGPPSHPRCRCTEGIVGVA